MIGKMKVTSSGYDPSKPFGFGNGYDPTLPDTVEVPSPSPGYFPEDNAMSRDVFEGFQISPLPASAPTVPGDPSSYFEDGVVFGLIDKIETFLWSHQDSEDPAWAPTEVHLIVTVRSLDQTDTKRMKFILRYRSEKAYAQQIEALVKSFKKVWGLRNF